MRPDIQQIKRDLKAFRIEEIFKEELGWDHRKEGPTTIAYKNQAYTFTFVAQKAGFKIYQHIFAERIPEERVLVQIDGLLKEYAHEHLTIFVDARRENQAWLWVRPKQENDKQRTRSRLYRFNKYQSGEALAQQLARLFISLDEEEHITLISVLDRVYQAFDVERVTTRFYERFKKEHADFMKCIENIPDEDDRKWYTSIMLNRLMFVYFIQRKGILDNRSNVRFEGDQDYLEKRLELVRREHGPDQFYRFYRYFLRRLFHEGLNQREHSSELERIIGRVPYINGGIFDLHILEQRYPDIQIKDEAFEQLFKFFQAFRWHLDDRPMRNDNEINPDVLGYIFEKYINQKQMGAYYTKEDITGYISKNTIIPFIFEKVAGRWPQAFIAGGPVWKLLQDNPDNYIYEEMAHGWLEALPPEIAAGIEDVTQRSNWNKAVDDERYALPTETWREVIERRKRYEEVREKITSGEITSINDLITYNLNITQFARDVIAGCDDPALLRAFYETIEQVTVLDPTCGSGAFLFAALNILKPLYEACIQRMGELVEKQSRQQAKPPSAQKESNHIAVFRQILDRVDQHRNQEYFILKSIIVNNLYGVDIMEEAIEICKLRLFLKLVAQINSPQELEPLPDIDFNVLAGNTLIGFTSMDEVRRVVTTKLINLGDTEKMLQRIEQQAQEIERDEQSFRNMQTTYNIEIDSTAISEYKQRLRKKLEDLRQVLDPYLATEYGIYKSKYTDCGGGYEQAYAQWKKSHKPFHWWAEFHKIMKNGGFDVVIGNPPYLEAREVNYSLRNYQTRASGAIHVMCIERGLQILYPQGCTSMIVPLALVSTQRMKTIQELLESQCDVWYSNYSWRPGKLFDTVNRALTIFVGTYSKQEKTFSTTYQKWTSNSRDTLMKKISYIEVPRPRTAFWVPKIGSKVEYSLIGKYLSIKTILGYFMANTPWRVYYRVGGGLYWKVFTDFPPAFNVNNQAGHSTRETWFTLANRDMISPVIAALSSSTFWVWYTITSNCRDLNPYDLHNFPVPESAIKDMSLRDLGERYLQDIQKNSTMQVRNQKQTGHTETQSFKLQKSKPIIDEIDRVLAQHYGFTPEELDFIINYDIKYRMGRNNGEEGEE